MADTLQDQLRALGLAKQPDRRDRPQRRKKRPASAGPTGFGGEIPLDKAYALREKAEQSAADKARKRKQAEDRRRREINQRIREIVEAKRLNAADAEVARHFMFRGRIRKLYVTEEQNRALTAGELGLVYLTGGYHVLDPEALDAVGAIGDPRAAGPVAVYLQDPDWRVRAAAAHALGGMPDRRASRALLRSLEDEHPRVGEQRPADLDQLHLGDPQVLDRRIRRGLETDLLEQPFGAAPQLSSVDQAAARRQRFEGEVLRDGQVGQQVQLLVDHANPGLDGLLRIVREVGLPVEEHLPAVGALDAGEDLHQRGLASAVLAHQRVYLARQDGEADAVERAHAGELLGQGAHLDDGLLVR